MVNFECETLSDIDIVTVYIYIHVITRGKCDDKFEYCISVFRIFKFTFLITNCSFEEVTRYVSMSSVLSKGAELNLEELSTRDLRRIIAVQQKEIKVKNDRLKGLEDLTKICSELEEKWQNWKTRADNYEIALKRAELRIAVLSKKLGIGPQAAFDIGVIYPGVSRKDFDAITRENIELKEALEHIVPTGLGGKDVVVVSN